LVFYVAENLYDLKVSNFYHGFYLYLMAQCLSKRFDAVSNRINYSCSCAGAAGARAPTPEISAPSPILVPQQYIVPRHDST